MAELKMLFTAVWNIMKTPMELPWIGLTSPLKIEIFLGLLAMIVWAVNRMTGNED